jgi:hypothetical protein
MVAVAVMVSPPRVGMKVEISSYDLRGLIVTVDS